MKFISGLYTDIGIKKQTNQDALLLKEANTHQGHVLLAAVCDGMGGLSKGELASSVLIRELDNWFQNTLPGHLCKGLTADSLKREWTDLVLEMNQRISDYGIQHRLNLGTTMTALLIVDQAYYMINIGDSRIYEISPVFRQITKDHTYVQREMDQGRMSQEQADVSKKRNVLLQCVGASKVIFPDFYSGTIAPNQVFLLCSDGFRHVITKEELIESLHASAVIDDERARKSLIDLTELVKQRNETDNISAILIKAI